MPKVLSNGLKIIFLGVSLVFIVWGVQEFLKAATIYSLFGWCYLMLGVVAPSVVLLGHSERRKEGNYLSSRTQVLTEAIVLSGLLLLGAGLLIPLVFTIQLIVSLVGFFMAVPASFIHLYLSAPSASSEKRKVKNERKMTN